VSATVDNERTSRRAHPDYSRAVLEDLYRYRRKRPLIAWVLWLFTGVLGGHRFYLERTGTGILMMFTGGGAMIWWLIDAMLLRKMVASYNLEQKQREESGMPPIALAFMPPLKAGQVTDRPDWASRRSGHIRLVGDAIVVIVTGLLLGAVTAETLNFEGVVAILALIGITSLGSRWEELARLPVLRSLDRWNHRLRLFYHYNDPGGPLALFFRPVTGLFSAFFRRRARAEVKLYMQLGGVFAVAFTLLDVMSAIAVSGDGLDVTLDEFIEDMALTFVSVYAFAAPIGATLTRHLLLERTDFILWALSALTVAALVVGLFT
jgi:hypothetical protein